MRCGAKVAWSVTRHLQRVKPTREHKNSEAARKSGASELTSAIGYSSYVSLSPSPMCCLRRHAREQRKVVRFAKGCDRQIHVELRPVQVISDFVHENVFELDVAVHHVAPVCVTFSEFTVADLIGAA